MRPRRIFCQLFLVFGSFAWGASAHAMIVTTPSSPNNELAVTDPVQVKIAEAYEALRAQQTDRAEKAFLEANRLNPTAVDALLGLAMVAQSQGKAEKAREWMARAVSAAPKRPEIMQAEARLLAEQGNTDAAINRYRKAIVAFPENVQIRLELASLYLEKLNKPGDAVNVLRELIKKSPGLAVAYLNMGLALSSDSRPEEAIKALNEASRLDPANPFAPHALGLLALKQGRAEQALEAFDKALALRPEFPGAAIGRGDSLAALGKLDKALEAYQRAASLAPRSALPHAMRAQLLERSKRLDEAEAAYRDALKAEPDHSGSMNNLAYLLVMRKARLDEALTLAQRAVAADPAIAGYLDTLGMVQLTRGDVPLARKSFERALALKPANTKYREHLALAVLAANDAAKASAPAAPAPASVPVAPAAAVAALKPVVAPPVQEVKSVAATAPASTQAKPPLEDPAKVIGPLLEGWRQAWEAKDASRYLAFYSKDFVPPAKKSLAAWEADRRAKLEKKGDIQVRVLNPFFVLSGNVATVVFDQQYQSSNFNDAGGKRLEWVKEGSEWRIRREGPR